MFVLTFKQVNLLFFFFVFLFVSRYLILSPFRFKSFSTFT